MTAAEARERESMWDPEEAWGARLCTYLDDMRFKLDPGTRSWRVTPSNLQRGLIVPDCHHPYVDKQAWQLLLKAARKIQPDTLILLGDWVDCHAVGNHPRTSPLKHTLEGELSAARFALQELTEACGHPTQKVFIEGNHETRLNRYIMQNAPELFGMLNIETALGLEELGWEFVPYGKSFVYGKLHLTHDTGKCGMNAHRQAATAHLSSTIIGHTHRFAYEVTGTFNGPPFLACMLGWLGDAETAGSYVHETGSASWAKGFGLTYRELDTGIVHVTPVPIISGKCMVEGELLEAT